MLFYKTSVDTFYLCFCFSIWKAEEKKKSKIILNTIIKTKYWSFTEQRKSSVSIWAPYLSQQNMSKVENRNSWKTVRFVTVEKITYWNFPSITSLVNIKKFGFSADLLTLTEFTSCKTLFIVQFFFYDWNKCKDVKTLVPSDWQCYDVFLLTLHLF